MTDSAVLPDHRPLDSRHPVEDVLDRLRELTDREELTIADMLNAFGRTAFLPLLIIMGIALVSPLSGVPLFSTIMGLSIGVTASQLLFGKETIWMPGFIRRRSLKATRLENAIDRVQGLARRLDRVTRARWLMLTRPPILFAVQVLTVLSGFTMPFLEFVPFSSSVLGLAVVLYAMAQLTRDGAFVFAGILTTLIGWAIPITAAFAVAQAV
ncbi:MAG: exopolysaccharide biosynthesis protein [Shimia sp.]